MDTISPLDHNIKEVLYYGYKVSNLKYQSGLTKKFYG